MPSPILLTDDPAVAARFVRDGQIAAFPTETVYGLGADALDARAVAQVFAAKGRPGDNPLIVHLADVAEVERVAARVPDVAARLLAAFAPGPLTLVLPRGERVPSVVSAGLATVGVRIPSHPVALAFLRACGRPVAAPSANRSGRPSPTTWEAVQADLGGRIPCILRGGRSRAGLESTVVDATEDPPLVLRAGAVSLEALRTVAPNIRLAGALEDARRRSPGTRHRHYAPRARVVLGVPSPIPPGAVYLGLIAPENAAQYAEVRVYPSAEAYARDLFAAFREADAAGATLIACEPVAPVGIGLALMDRIRRAAEG